LLARSARFPTHQVSVSRHAKMRWRRTTLTTRARPITTRSAPLSVTRVLLAATTRACGPAISHFTSSGVCGTWLGDFNFWHRGGLGINRIVCVEGTYPFTSPGKRAFSYTPFSSLCIFRRGVVAYNSFDESTMSNLLILLLCDLSSLQFSLSTVIYARNNPRNFHEHPLPTGLRIRFPAYRPTARPWTPKRLRRLGLSTRGQSTTHPCRASSHFATAHHNLGTLQNRG